MNCSSHYTCGRQSQEYLFISAFVSPSIVPRCIGEGFCSTTHSVLFAGKWALLFFLSSIPWLVICSPVMLLVSEGSNDLMPAKTCAFAHVQNSERGLSSPSSGIFLLMRYFQALKQSENFMPLWTVQLFQIYLSNGKVDLKITRCILFWGLFWSCYIHFWTDFLFSGTFIKSTWSWLNYYHFPAPFVVPISGWSVWILCSTSLTHCSSYGLCVSHLITFPFCKCWLCWSWPSKTIWNWECHVCRLNKTLQPNQDYYKT